MVRLDRIEDARAAGVALMAGEAMADVNVTPEFLAAAAGVEKRL
jgi:hypothetical protein